MKVKAVVLIDRHLVFGTSSKFVAHVKVMLVNKSVKFPEGIKAKFVLIDSSVGKPVLLLDNHAPYGFHIHSKMPEEPEFREKIIATDYSDALKIFFDMAESLVKNDEE